MNHKDRKDHKKGNLRERWFSPVQSGQGSAKQALPLRCYLSLSSRAAMIFPRRGPSGVRSGAPIFNRLWSPKHRPTNDATANSEVFFHRTIKAGWKPALRSGCGSSAPCPLRLNRYVLDQILVPQIAQTSQRGRAATKDVIWKSGKQEERRRSVPEFLSSKSKSSLNGTISCDSGTDGSLARAGHREGMETISVHQRLLAVLRARAQLSGFIFPLSASFDKGWTPKAAGDSLIVALSL